MNIMDDKFSLGLRAALADHVKVVPTRRRRHWIIAGILSSLLIAGSGLAYATGLLLPGRDEIFPVGEPITIHGQGTQKLDLGTPPPNANGIEYHITCETLGDFTLSENGPRISCNRVPDSMSVIQALTEKDTCTNHHMASTDTALALQAEDNSHWTVVARFVTIVPTSWGINAAGQTYGAENCAGTPTLVGVEASNGVEGYVYSADLTSWEPANPEEAALGNPNPGECSVPVYASDGVTVLGEFVFGGC